MTQTFNIGILNNSFQMSNKKLNMTSTIENTMGNTVDSFPISGSPRAIRSLATESLAAFTVIPNAKIPDLTETRREEREEREMSILRRPKHKRIGRDQANRS